MLSEYYNIELQKFIYSLFEHTLLTNQGKAIVKTYENNYNALAIYKGLYNYFTKPFKVAISISNTLSYLTIACISKFGRV